MWKKKAPSRWGRGLARVTFWSFGQSRSRQTALALLGRLLDRQDDGDLVTEAVVAAGGPEKIIEGFLKSTDRVIDAVRPWAEVYQPEAVQKQVVGPVGGYPTLGFIDLRDTAGVVTDTKFFTKRKQEDEAEVSNQLRLYQILERKAGEPATKAELFGIYPVKDGYKSQTLTQEPSPEGELRFEEVAHNVGRTIEAGIFAPVNLDGPLSWVCSRKWCGFYEMCPYGRAGRRSA